MVATGPRPAHRRGTTGRPWRRFRERQLRGATHCANCGRAFIRDAWCEHRSHQGLRGCPTHPAYPTLEHPHPLIEGGAVRDPANALSWCHRCNSGGGTRVRLRHGRTTPLEW